MTKCKWCGNVTENTTGWTGNLCSGKCIKEHDDHYKRLAEERRFKNDAKKCSFCGELHLDGVQDYLTDGKTYRNHYFCNNRCFSDYKDRFSVEVCDSDGFTYDSDGRASRKRWEDRKRKESEEAESTRRQGVKSARESAYGTEENYYKELTKKLNTDTGGSWWKKLF
jgi:hypothetical protein